MAKALKLLYSNSMENTPVRHVLTDGVAAFTADTSFVFTAPFDGRFTDISQAFMATGTIGVDAVDPLFVELEVTVGGTSIFATKPKLDKAGSDGDTTLVAGTGITVGALSATPADLEFSKGDVIIVTLDLTATTEDTDFANLAFCVILQELADYDPDMTAVRPPA